MSDGVPCHWMRGGTSKGGYFVREDLPEDEAQRDAFLLRIMGSPDARQIDGMGGGDPLTSKVAIVSKSERPEVDVDYLFLQVFVDQPVVSPAQNCGNILAGVGPFALERGLIPAAIGETKISIHMSNSGQNAVALIQTPDGKVTYEGDAQIDGVPGRAAPVLLEFQDTAGSSCGALLPTGQPVDVVCSTPTTLIDNGMPCVIMTAASLGITGYEDRSSLESNEELKRRLEAIRIEAGPLMNLGDVRTKSVPKMMLVAPPSRGGTISVRSFIPHRVHASVGVLGAVTVSSACLIEGSIARQVATVPGGKRKTLSVEHPSGEMSCVLETDDRGSVISAAILRTARKLFQGTVFA